MAKTAPGPKVSDGDRLAQESYDGLGVESTEAVET
jgi:hypothetical protein